MSQENVEIVRQMWEDYSERGELPSCEDELMWIIVFTTVYVL